MNRVKELFGRYGMELTYIVWLGLIAAFILAYGTRSFYEEKNEYIAQFNSEYYALLDTGDTNSLVLGEQSGNRLRINYRSWQSSVTVGEAGDIDEIVFLSPGEFYSDRYIDRHESLNSTEFVLVRNDLSEISHEEFVNAVCSKLECVDTYMNSNNSVPLGNHEIFQIW